MPKIYEIRKEIGGFSEISRIRRKTPKFGGAKNTGWQILLIRLSNPCTRLDNYNISKISKKKNTVICRVDLPEAKT